MTGTETTTGAIASPAAVCAFWFETLKPDDWFRKSAALDATIRRRFGATLAAAARCELWAWRIEPQGRLAEVIVLDQFSRNIFRDTPQAFACDPLALGLAQEAVASGADKALPGARRAFIYMPYMHSESRLIHAQAKWLFAQPGLETQARHEAEHAAIVERFGRYPHRNAILGRESSAAEEAFLRKPGSSF
jgi:uncharacterized protein (DUF924 family)